MTREGIAVTGGGEIIVVVLIVAEDGTTVPARARLSAAHLGGSAALCRSAAGVAGVVFAGATNYAVSVRSAADALIMVGMVADGIVGMADGIVVAPRAGE